MDTNDVILSVSAGILALTLVALLWYAWEARKQAKATIQPVLVHWLDVERQKILYWNVGNGPALRIRWLLRPVDLRDERIAVGVKDEKGCLDKFPMSGTAPLSLVAE